MVTERKFLLASAFLLIAAATSKAQIIAQTGFNDSSGINSDGTANSPYNISNVSLIGQGAGETGWLGTWTGTNANVQSSTVLEGDGAASFFQNTGFAYRQFSQGMTAGVFRAEINFMATGTINNDIIFRLRDNSVANIFSSIATQWQVQSDNHFHVFDGTENSDPTGAPTEDTGIVFTYGVWHNVVTEVEMGSRTWTIIVDGFRYVPPDPLGFRGIPTVIDAVEYLSEIAGPSGSFLDSVRIIAVPEPSSCLMIAAATISFGVARRPTRRLIQVRKSGSVGAKE